MDQVMKVVFGNIPIEQLNAVQAAASRNINTNTFLLLGGVAIVLGVTTFVLYQNNKRLKNQLDVIKVHPKK